MSFQQLFLLTSLALSVLFTVDATQIMGRPGSYKDPPHTVVTESNPKVNVIQRRAGSKTSFAYFTNWGIYAPNFHATDIVSAPLTHILYAFADTDPSSGAIKLTDNVADETKHYSGDSESVPGNNLYGNLKQLYLLKLKQRNLKVLLSIGGWTYSQDGHFGFVTSPSARATFVSSAVRVIEDYGFDGIDLDFEYPADADQAQGFANLLTALRSAFNALQAKKGDSTRYLLTAAVAAGPENYSSYKVSQMDAALDYWNLMAYDYAGPWSTFSENQANLYGGHRSGISTNAAVEWYIANGASASKINLGMPLYGRAFVNTGGLGQSFSGIGPGTIEAGVYSYKSLPLAGAQVYENTTDISSHSYDPSKKEFVSYDTPNIAKMKVQYVISKGLAGVMFWELSTDKVGSGSLVGTAARNLGTLDQTQNHIHYPNSKWDNIKNNMGQGSTTTPDRTTPRPDSSGKCSGVAAWSSTSVYTKGMTAVYGGHLWTAQWWTQNETPGGSSGVWVGGGAC